ncbi:MAG: ferredoxin family protein [Lachnospiraceae bacterium]|jgi:adenylylsulfate reductase subunit B|uniref:4Fe-4S dicluster domain-containing protein n=1 Tax=Clostridium sp. (strain SY8519) TaxID=1042156 RepID=UPI00021719E2|nr:ferredoxin family protein [Clostridium sp. SY8519]MCI1653701.1 ferredoxin family protein [Lachnospiraceae bacterium]MCI1656386.1 ferredoxin family protein [Lachnospiraceae bacterium]MCI2194868.1 ferredoxin family protein [Lachnospiraceae bacterium]BAK47480.1 hypothetical protein CXIVA_15140 [Clostridium sp. SY8519]
MSIRIDRNQCVGCGRCEKVCPGSLIAMNREKAEILYPADCWGCASCLKECPAGAIEFFLGKDMGGGDTYMKAERRGQYLDWKFYHPDGLFKTIEIDRTSSNKY